MRSAGIMYAVDGVIRGSWSWNGDGDCPFLLAIKSNDSVCLLDNTHAQVPDVIPP
mgnify:CR=1 FL=1